jgi:hypothetical protein
MVALNMIKHHMNYLGQFIFRVGLLDIGGPMYQDKSGRRSQINPTVRNKYVVYTVKSVACHNISDGS